MSARYRIVLADQLVAMGLVFPDGVSLAARGEAAGAGTHWYEVDDQDAAPELDGCEVSLSLARVDGKPVIKDRHVIVTHLTPAEGESSLPCCGQPPWDIHRADRMHWDAQAATCRGSADAEPDLAGAVSA